MTAAGPAARVAPSHEADQDPNHQREFLWRKIKVTVTKSARVSEVLKINFRLSLISKFTCFQAFMLENIRNKPGFLLEKLQAYQVKNQK